jgi:hypothetical protein
MLPLMTAINWERHPGETVEEFVEALILTTVNPRAVRITPSRGDKGVDILAPVGDQFDVYQVKRYTRPFGKSSNEENSIINSWNHFVNEFMPAYPIRRWNLVMPWNPSTERHNWMLNELTAGVTIERDWLGRGTLDVWSSQNASLVEYFFGNGQNRMMELLASALSAAREIPEATGKPLIDAIIMRESELARQLDEVDPFYRYEVSVRRGRLTDSVLDQLQTVDSRAALVTFRELDDDYYQQMSIYPKCVESGRLRPISTTLSVDPTADEDTLRAARDLIAYGAEPDRPLPVNIIRSEGPPGAESSTGPALLYVMNADQPARPDLELRMGETRLPFKNVVITRGFHGLQLSGEDEGGVFKVIVTFHDSGQTREIAVETLSIDSKPPHVVVPGLSFLHEWAGGTSAFLAIPYGKTVMSFGPLPDASAVHDETGVWLEVAKNLLRLQVVSARQLLMPGTMTNIEAEDIGDAVRLIEGEKIESEWTRTQFQIQNKEALAASLASGPLFQFLTFQPFSIKYQGAKYELDGVVASWGVAQLADPSLVETVSVGDQVTIVPGADGKLYRQYGSPEAMRTGEPPAPESDQAVEPD